MRTIKRLAFTCAIVGILGTFSVTGCGGKAVTAESLLKKAESKESDNLSMDMLSEITINLEDAKMNFQYARVISKKGTVKSDGKNLYAEISTSNKETLDEASQDVTQDMKMYTVPEGETERVYISVDNSAWMYYDQEHKDVPIYSLPEIYQEGVEWTLSEQTEKVNGEDAYLLTAELPVTSEMVENSLGDVSDAMSDIFKNLDYDNMKVGAKIWIAAARNGGLLQGEYDWGNAFSSDKFAGTELEGFSASLKETYTNISYGDVKIEVPEDVISGAVKTDMMENDE